MRTHSRENVTIQFEEFKADYDSERDQDSYKSLEIKNLSAKHKG
jgi:hypothetical protein